MVQHSAQAFRAVPLDFVRHVSCHSDMPRIVLGFILDRKTLYWCAYGWEDIAITRGEESAGWRTGRIFIHFKCTKRFIDPALFAANMKFDVGDTLLFVGLLIVG